MRTKPTEAFEKYVDPIFLCQNHLWNYAPKNCDGRFDHNFKLEEYEDEKALRAGMCVFLVEEIQDLLNFKNTLETYKNKKLKVASNWDIDAIEANKQHKDLDDKLFAHAKLEYCFINYIHGVTENNDINMLACLMAMYVKIIKLKKEKQGAESVKDITHTKFYRYVKDAYLEECEQDIKKFSKFDLKSFADKIFDMIVERCYDLEHAVDETMFSSEGTALVLRIYSVEEANDLKDLKKEMEQEVRDWMMAEIYKHDNLLKC